MVAATSWGFPSFFHCLSLSKCLLLISRLLMSFKLSVSPLSLRCIFLHLNALISHSICPRDLLTLNASYSLQAVALRHLSMSPLSPIFHWKLSLSILMSGFGFPSAPLILHARFQTTPVLLLSPPVLTTRMGCNSRTSSQTRYVFTPLAISFLFTLLKDWAAANLNINSCVDELRIMTNVVAAPRWYGNVLVGVSVSARNNRMRDAVSDDIPIITEFFAECVQFCRKLGHA